MSKNKNRTPSSSRDSKMEKTKVFLGQATDVLIGAGKVIVAIGTIYGTCKGLKGNKKS